MKRKLLALSLVFLALLLGFELLLQVAAWLQPAAPELTRPLRGSRILCVGDSHTYGLHVTREANYPAQMQTALDSLLGPGKYTVINRGVPGMNSSQIASSLKSWLDEFDPSYVILCGGVNNVWNTTKPVDGHLPWYWKLRTYKFMRIALHGVEGGRLKIKRKANDKSVRWKKGGELFVEHLKGRVENYEAWRMLADDLKRIDEMCRNAGAQLILLTYAASDNYERIGYANSVLRTFARCYMLAVVDAAVHFDSLPPGRYYLKPGDPHPNQQGYEEIAWLVATAIRG